MDQQTRIYLLGHSVLDRVAYRLLLKQELDLQVHVDSAYTPTDIWNAMRTRPDIAIADSDAPDASVRDCVAMIPRLRAETRIVALSAAVTQNVVLGWVGVPLQGYVVKDGGISELAAALRAVQAGGTFFSDGVRETLRNGRPASDALSKLSRREAELLPLLARGMPLRDAAQLMTVSYKTADSYRTSLLRKLGVKGRVELTRLAIREKIVDP